MVDDWPFVKRTPDNPGSTPKPGPRQDPTLEWRHDARARIFGTPVVAGGIVYVGTTAQTHWDGIGCVVAIETATGERAWMAADEALEIRGTPGVADGTVYAGDLDNRGYVLDQADGTLVHLDDDEMGLTPADGVCPLVHEDTVFITPFRLEARHADSWAIEWTLGGEDLVVSEPPAIHDDTVLVACKTPTGQRTYVGQDEGYPTYVHEVKPSLKAVDPANGSVRWTRSLPGRARSPAISEGVAFVATRASDPQGKRMTAVKPCSDEQPVPDEAPADYSEFGTIHAVDVDTGGEYWAHRLDDQVKTTPAIYRDTVCVGTTSGSVVAIDAASGTRKWETSVNDDASVLSWPTIAADTVYVGSRDECLYALDRHDGTIRWRFETDAAVDSNPAVVDGTVYVGDNGGTVYAIGGE